jgi:threonine/homoserine/homoserine lactone efflux protein
MTLHSYILFAGASVVLAIVPGPDMIYMLGRCVAQGRKAGLMAAIGFNLGGYAHLTAAIFGLSAVIATSVAAFTHAPSACAIRWRVATSCCFIALACNVTVVTLSASVTASLRRNTSVSAWLQRALGATFLALGIRLAVEKS